MADVIFFLIYFCKRELGGVHNFQFFLDFAMNISLTI